MLTIGSNFVNNCGLNTSNIVNLDESFISSIGGSFLKGNDNFDGTISISGNFSFRVFSDSDLTFSSSVGNSSTVVNGINILSNNYLACFNIKSKFPNSTSNPYRNINCTLTNVVFHLENGFSFCVSEDELRLLSNDDPSDTSYIVNNITFTKEEVVRVEFLDSYIIITDLPDYCFYNFINLKMDDIPSYINNIGSYFRGFNYLSEETVINIPSNVLSIGDHFYTNIRDFTGVFNHQSNSIPDDSFTCLNDTCLSFINGFEFVYKTNSIVESKTFYLKNPNSDSVVYRNWRNIVLLNINPDNGDVDVPINETVLIETNYDNYFNGVITSLDLTSGYDIVTLTYNNDIPLTFSNGKLELVDNECEPQQNQSVNVNTLDKIVLTFNEPLRYYLNNLFVYKENSNHYITYEIDNTQSTLTKLIYNCNNLTSLNNNTNYVFYISRLLFKSSNYLNEGQIVYKFNTV